MNEKDILKKLGHHRHLTELYASYKYEGKWHLILPYADADLRNYWEMEKDPKFDTGTVLWSLQQMLGIAEGLYRVHVFKPTWSLGIEGKVLMQTDATLQVQDGEELYGRHGDFKPQNILWFSSDPDVKDQRGILKITDFGLGRFHGRDSRSKSEPHNKRHSETYEPPELRLGQEVSRAYDFWSLGCVYLEFVTWLLKGYQGIEQFSAERLHTHPIIPKFLIDTFFTEVDIGITATVGEAVIEWVRKLHEHERCSELIHDLLDLITSEMLCIDKEKRAKAHVLVEKLRKFLQKAEKDEGYLVNPMPRESMEKLEPSPTSARSLSKVHFENQDQSNPSHI